MLTAKPTENLTGVTIEGEYDDFYNLVDAIHHMTGFEESYDDMYYGVKNRLLGICYDLRHAYQGNREICMIDNGMDEYKMKWHSMITPTQNVHFSVNVYFPEAVFVALSAPELFIFSRGEYGSRRKDEEEHVYAPKFAEYLQDKAQIELLCSVILGALGEVIGDEELEKMLRHHSSLYRMEYNNYATMYVDKCNIEYFKTPARLPGSTENFSKGIPMFTASLFSNLTPNFAQISLAMDARSLFKNSPPSKQQSARMDVVSLPETLTE